MRKYRICPAVCVEPLLITAATHKSGHLNALSLYDAEGQLVAYFSDLAWFVVERPA